jgi:hypothetical protein
MADRIGVITGRDHPGRRQGRSDAEARQERVEAAPVRQNRCDPRLARHL